MRNLYTCDNCIFNPVQYQDIGARTGFCLKHDSLLFSPSLTTCRHFRRKDLPYFVCEEGHEEHRKEYQALDAIVYFETKHEVEKRFYSERYAWESGTFDSYLHEVAIYHRSGKKSIYLQAFLGSRNPVKNIIHSCLVRRYILQCGPNVDNYRILLSSVVDMAQPVDIHIRDFRIEVDEERFAELRDIYLKEIFLLRIYAIQEYGALTENEQVMWLSDELNGAIEASWSEFAIAVRRLIPEIQTNIIKGAQQRGTFFTEPSDDAVTVAKSGGG